MPEINYKERRAVYRPEKYPGQNYRESILGNLLLGPVTPPAPRPARQQVEATASGPRPVYRKFPDPLPTIPVGTAMTAPLHSPHSQAQGQPAMAQSRLFPRPGASPVQNRSAYGTMNGQPTRAMTLMDVKDDPYSGPLAQLMQGQGQRAQVPMQGPITPDHGIGRLITTRPGLPVGGWRVPNPTLESPYYQARAARNALGKGSPYIPGGQKMTQAQRNAGYAQMAQNGGMAPPAFDQSHPLWGKTPDQARAMIAQLQDRLADPNAYKAATYVSPQGTQYNPTQVAAAPPQSPMQRLGFAAPDAQQAQPNPMNRLVPAGSPRPIDYAGDATTAEQAAGRRALGMQMLENRGVGYVDQATGAFIGRGARTFPSDGTGTGAFAGRLAAGGVTPSNMTPEQAGANRLSMLQRLADKRSTAMARVQALAQQSTAERRARLAGPSPLDRLLANNPQAAMALRAQEAQFQNQQRLQQLENEGRLGVARLEGQNQQQRNQIGGLAALVGAGVPLADARAQLGLPAIQGQQAPNALPKFQPGAFAGANKQTFDYLKETLKDLNDDNALSLMDEMGVPQELQAGLLDRVKPSWWRRINKEANAGTAGGKGVAPMIPGWTR